MKFQLKLGMIEAIQYMREDNIHDVQYFFEQNRDRHKFRYQESLGEYAVVTGERKEKKLEVLAPGDYIIRRLDGSYHVYREDEFLKKYERVPDNKKEGDN